MSCFSKSCELACAARLFTFVGVVCAMFFYDDHAVCAAEETKLEKVKIVLVGDSTVTDTAGWGLGFAKLLGPGVECFNGAKGGASSKSFYDASYWKTALAQKPNYVLIQFGHNDQPGKGPNRETLPQTTYKEYLTRFIDETRAAGAEPILVTSMVRRIFGPDAKLVDTLAPYAEAMRQLAAEKKVPLIDLHKQSLELVERLGPDGANALSPPHPKLAGKFDGTHLSANGAVIIAPLVVAGLRDVVPALRDRLPAPTEKPASAK